LFQLFATGVIDTGGKFTTGVLDTSGNLPLSLTPKFATGINGSSNTDGKIYHRWMAKFTAGVVDTGCKFASSVVDTGGAS
jgi:hypothetical protein